MERNVQLAQVNHTYAGHAWLPYSAGIVQANAQAQPDLRDIYKFSSPIFLRENPKNVADSLKNPDVLGISCYIWNWEWSKALAREVRKQHPKTLIVMGGPQVPAWSDDFFQSHPYVDILAHGEGEITFSNILRERLKENPDYSKVRGITFNQNDVSVRTQPQPRATEKGVDKYGIPTPYLEEIVSPYLFGIFEELMKAHPELGFNATSETHRGCPYSCEFCDWGSATYQHVDRFSDERVKAEYEWISKHKIPFVYNADANYMLFAEDEGLNQYLIELNRLTGFPKHLRANWAKNSQERIFTAAKQLNAAGMDMGITIALQSLHDKTLEVIKRKNIKWDIELHKYNDARIPTYTELILPLPEETYETFVNGLETLLNNGLHTGINIYQCMLLPNSGMSHPTYIKEYGIIEMDSPILQNHSTPGTDSIKERTRYAIATNSMSLEDFKKAFLYGWAIQTFHSQGLTQDIAIYLKQGGISYRDFYEGLLSEAPDTIPGREVVDTKRSLEKVLNGKNNGNGQHPKDLTDGQWGKIELKYGDIVWPFEEFSFLNIITGKREIFYRQVQDMVKRRFGTVLPDEVIRQQIARLRTPEDYNGDVKEYAKRAVWFGRKSGTTFKNNRESVGIST